MDDTISQVFDEIHQSSNTSAVLNTTQTSSDDIDSANEGFIGKHLKKLQKQEAEQKKKLEEERRALEIEKYGSLLGKEDPSTQAQLLANDKPKGIMARAKAKIFKEMRDEQEIQLDGIVPMFMVEGKQQPFGALK